MPTYVYRCPDGHEFEAFHKMSEEGPQACEVCEKSPVERVLFPVAVHFKGSGFYATDYGRGNRKRESASDGESSGEKSGESSERKSSESSSSGESGSASDSSAKGSSSSEGASEKKSSDS